MVFSLRAIDQQGQTRDFFWQVERLEDGLEVLSSVVAKGHVLLKAQVVDNGQVTLLPLTIFDGLPFAESIRVLENEWQQLLATPLKTRPTPLEHAPSLGCTIFTSTLVSSLAKQDLVGILRKSRLHNAQWGISGVMLHANGHIIQVIEGDEKAVDALWKRIEQDPRHTHVMRIFNRPVGHPLFGAWSMGYATITARQLANMEDIMATNVHQEPAQADEPHVILKTIKTLYETNHLR